MDLVALGLRFFVTKPKAVVLSVWVGVAGCLWPISSSSRLAGMACLVLTNKAPISESAADVMTLRIILAMFRTAPLFFGNFSLFDMKKCPSALLLALASVK